MENVSYGLLIIGILFMWTGVDALRDNEKEAKRQEQSVARDERLKRIGWL